MLSRLERWQATLTTVQAADVELYWLPLLFPNLCIRLSALTSLYRSQRYGPFNVLHLLQITYQVTQGPSSMGMYWEVLQDTLQSCSPVRV